MKKYFFNFLFLMMIFSFVIFSCANTTVAWENDDEDSSATIIEKSELFVSTITSSSLIETVFETNSTEYKSSTGYSLWSLQERESVSSVDVGLNKIQGSLSCGYGIVFDVKACSGVSGDDVAGGDGCDSGDDVANGVSTADSMLVLMIRVSGEYLVGKVSDGIFTSICPWTKDENLKTGSGNENKIKLYKSEGEYFVSFNGDEVSTSFFDPRQIDNASQEDSENAIENFGYVVVIAPNENFPKSNVKVIFSREGE